jgi:class 3 adenylate cyclase/pimeloyl-ACP methyl ester carboxylesterase
VENEERRLLAILFTDIVGYTAMLGKSEAKGIEARDEHRRLIQTLAAQFHGRFVDESGDASLAIFPSAIDAVKCAMAVQAVLAADPVFQVRAGIHVGDVVEHDGRLIGDGINVASRLPALAQPGGIVATTQVVEHLRNQNIGSTTLGAQTLKNVDHPVEVFSVGAGVAAAPRRISGGRIAFIAALAAAALFAVWVFLLDGNEDLMVAGYRMGLIDMGAYDVAEHEIAFTDAEDGVRIAYATAGNPNGSPVVIVLGWATHLEEGLGVLNPFVQGLLDDHRVIVYDGRGTGLSDRNVEDVSLDAKVRDLEAVVDAADIQRFGIVAVSAGGPTSVAYTVNHPERVTRIAFYGSFLWLGGVPGHLEMWRTFPALVRASWGSDNPVFRQLFTNLFFPDADDLMRRMFNEFQRVAMTPDDAANFITSLNDTDTRALAPQVAVPVLVVHRRGDQVVPYGLGRDIAARIPGAKLSGMEGNNHAPSYEEREAVEELAALLRDFFAHDAAARIPTD